MLKKDNLPSVTFADVWLSHTEKNWDKHWLKKVSEKVNWNKFGYRFEKLYNKENGRPAWDPIILFKSLLLAQWHGLSDRDLEEALNDRISFRKFVGLKWEEQAPDASTFAVFRERILPIFNKLLRILNIQLEEAGFKIKEVVAIDATLVAAHSKPHGDFAGDEEASWRGFPSKEVINDSGHKCFARRPALYGYKINLSASIKTGYVSNLSVCPASEHESKHFLELLTKETKKVYADKGYYGCKKLLQHSSVIDGIHDKGFKNRPLTRSQIVRNKRISKHRGIVEGVFGSWKQLYGWIKTKYYGLEKNHLAATLTAISWNMKKMAFSTA
jgi:IS5 family transposase